MFPEGNDNYTLCGFSSMIFLDVYANDNYKLCSFGRCIVMYTMAEIFRAYNSKPIGHFLIDLLVLKRRVTLFSGVI